MGWLYAEGENESEGGNHEGWVVAVLSDGTDAEQDTFDDAEETWKRRVNWAWSYKYDGKEGRRKAQGLRVICYCGWRGARRPVDFADPDACDVQLRQEWERHCEISMSRMLTQRLQRLTSDLAVAFDELTGTFNNDSEPARPLLAAYAATSLLMDVEAWQRDAVRAARKGGFSWDEISGPLMMSKQSAHEKFAKHMEADTEETP
ncbi:hypothetical protein E4N62_20055 [Streptomyces sp. MNU76]|uniref:hypothetical protein n=1 Tax=Streptomyces sp. MNU76 TaxID=2560026 RepID=UPI001E3D7FD1|nr:hypothetical protein [Streptomyces sp. MNU76]MCC9707372.1 hypothetical protein [Streptomyces sp. MNU76]